MTHTTPARIAVPAALALAITACGGGSSGGLPPNAAPIADLDAVPASGIAELVVDFDGSASSDSDGSIAAWAWDFGDGHTGSGSTARHTYTAPGTYTATLTVTDDRGGTDTATRDITVTANTLPAARMTTSLREGFSPLTVTFDGSASSDANGPITVYHWDFGNGDTSAIAAPAALYDAPGQYTAELTVTDNSGGTATTAVTVYVATPGDTFALAGSVSVPDTAFTDCDTAATLAAGSPTGCNDVAAGAQSLPSPATVGGHAAHAADAADFYTLSLAGGETLSLAVADSSPGNNLDLMLYAADGTTLIDASSGPNHPLESLTVASAGTYFVQVDAAAGSSNYVLTVGTAPTTAGSDNGDAFIDGEFIAHFTQPRLPWRLDAQGEARSAELGMDVQGANPDAPMLLRDRTRPSRSVRRSLDDGMQSTLQALRRHPDIAWAEPNRVRHALAVDATDTYYPLQWNLPLAHFPGAWDVDSLLRGSGTVVAVIDTGILASHPDLAGRVAAGYDFISDALNAGDGDGIDADPNDEGGDGIGRSTFHGSHVAGIVAANAQFAPGAGNTGVAGAAPQAQVMPLRVIGRYGGTSYDIIQAILYAAGLPNDSNTVPAAPADVINLSIGSTGYSQAEQDAITAARAAGVIVVAAGGNTGTAATIYPAAYSGVIGVGAVTLDRSRAPYSTSGAHIDIAAPGGDNAADLDGNGFPDGVLGTLANDSNGLAVPGYDFYQGTSMAAPHVAATAAMMKALLPTLTPSLFDTLLANGDLTRDLGAGGRDDLYGMGLLDAEKALVATGTVTATPAVPVASPVRVSLGATATQAVIVVDNGGGGTLTITGVSDDQPWLSVSAQAIDASGIGSYLVSIDRNALANGNYVGTVSFVTSAGTLDVPVNMIVDASIPAATAGTLYVIVWDPKEQATVAQAILLPGESAFSLLTVPDVAYTGPTAGNYQVYAGTDNDNDGFVCDAGEACGAWVTLDSPTLFAHVRDRADLAFHVGYPNTLTTLSAGTPAATLPARGLPRR